MERTEADDVGLCVRCVHARVVSTPRSRFWRCGLSDQDARFVRYPALPVRACSGYVAMEPGAPGASGGTPDA